MLKTLSAVTSLAFRPSFHSPGARHLSPSCIWASSPPVRVSSAAAVGPLSSPHRLRTQRHRLRPRRRGRALPAERGSALPADKQIDLSTADLRKLRVRELRRILDDWGEACKGCAEKSDFIRRIHELMPKYAPRAAGARADL